MVVTAAGPCFAAAPDAPNKASTPLDGLTVFTPPKDPPAVIATFPAGGQSVAPGVLILKVVFNQRMSPDGWNYAKDPAGAQPHCLARPRLLPDEKTFVLLCTTGPGAAYVLKLNTLASGGFANRAGMSAVGYVLSFSTSSSDSVTTVEDAIKAAGLKPEESPILDDKQIQASR